MINSEAEVGSGADGRILWRCWVCPVRGANWSRAGANAALLAHWRRCGKHHTARDVSDLTRRAWHGLLVDTRTETKQRRSKMNKATTAQVAKMESWGWSTEAIEAWVVRDAAERNLRKVARKAGVNVTGQPSTLIVRDNVDATVTEAARTLAQAEINFQSTQG